MEPVNQILHHFEKFITVSESLKQELIDRLDLVCFKKGDLVFDAKKVCTESYFICDGLLRTYFIKDEKEICEFFSSENQWSNSPRSWRKKEVDVYYVGAVENSTALCLKSDDMIYFLNNYPEMDRYARLSMVTLMDNLVDRITSFRFTSADEKYNHFKEAYPDIYHRIPLNMVASYLGVSPETLSRLRARM